MQGTTPGASGHQMVPWEPGGMKQSAWSSQSFLDSEFHISDFGSSEIGQM